MRDRIDEFGTSTDVVLVTFTDVDNLTDYIQEADTRFCVLVDPDRLVYRAFGLGRGSLSAIWGWKTARRYFRILRTSGFGALRRPTEDTRQLGGDFVVNPDGVLVFGFWSDGPADRPSVDDLIDAVRRSLPA